MVEQTAQLLKEVVFLQKKVQQAVLPTALQEKVLMMLQRLSRLARYGEYSREYEKVTYFVDWIINLPWTKRSRDVLDLNHARKTLDANHYGLQEVKERILEYIAVLKLQSRRQSPEQYRAPILCFIGLVGTGKTSIAFSIAKALGRKFARIPFGGLANPLDLRGQSKFQPDAEPGLIIKALRRVGSKNPVILLDEVDRVAPEGRGGIMGVLVELLDPGQNMAFRDHFIDFPFDLSQVLFVATANNTTNISVAVMDRLEVIQMPSYNDEEKTVIAKEYLLPRILKEVGLGRDVIKIDDEVWPKIIRPLGYDAGVRTLERMIESMVRKVVKKIIEGKGKRFTVNAQNIKDFVSTW